MAESVSKEQLEKIKEGYISLFIRQDDPTIEHHVKRLFVLHDDLVRKAQKSDDPNEAFGLLKQASGILLIVEDIETYTSKRLRRD